MHCILIILSLRRGLLALWQYMRNEMGINTEETWESIQELIVKTIIRYAIVAGVVVIIAATAASLIPRPPRPAFVATASDKSWAWRPGNEANCCCFILFLCLSKWALQIQCILLVWDHTLQSQSMGSPLFVEVVWLIILNSNSTLSRQCFCLDTIHPWSICKMGVNSLLITHSLVPRSRNMGMKLDHFRCGKTNLVQE